MNKCFFCKKRIWYWQKSDCLKSHHISCHIADLKKIIQEKGRFFDAAIWRKEILDIGRVIPEYLILLKEL
jgi:hypothetical protein